MIGLFLSDSSDLSEREQYALAALINACVKKAVGFSICPKAKGDPDSKLKQVFDALNNLTNSEPNKYSCVCNNLSSFTFFFLERNFKQQRKVDRTFC